MAKLLILALFCVAIAAAAPPFQLEDEPRSLDVASHEDDDLDFDDEPRSADSELEPYEDDNDDDLDMFNMVPDMRDGAEKLDVDDDDSEDLEPTERGWWSRMRRRVSGYRTRWNNWKVRRFGRWARNCNPSGGMNPWRVGIRCRF